MRIIATGAAGYVGGHVAAILRDRGHDLVALARDAAQAARLKERGVRALVTPLEDTGGLRAAVAAADAVLHAAASDDPAFHPVNAAAVAAMLDGLPDRAAFVTHGGTLVYGPTGPAGVTAAAPPAPPPFLQGRVALEEGILAAGGRLRTAVVHAGLVYGGRGAVLPGLLVQAARALGAAPFVGDGANAWTSVHVADWAALLADALEATPAGGRRYVATGRIVTMRAVAETLAAVAGLPGARSLDPAEAEARFGPFALALGMDQRFLPGPERDLLGWSPRIDDLAQGFRDLLAG